MSFTSNADAAFVSLAAEIACQPLGTMLKGMGVEEPLAASDMASFGMRGYATDGKYIAMTVDVGKLDKALNKNQRVDENDHNYRRRYGPEKGGDKEYWEALMKRNPAQVLPMLLVSMSSANGIYVSDIEGDASYVNAMLRDNGWLKTVVAVKKEDAEEIRTQFGVDDGGEPINMDFMLRYEDQIVEALEVLKPGKVIGTAIKVKSRPAMGMARPVFQPRIRDVVLPRGNLWNFEGNIVTTEELLAAQKLQATQVAVQVHYQLVSAFMDRHTSPRKGLVPKDVWQTYTEKDGDFAYLN